MDSYLTHWEYIIFKDSIGQIKLTGNIIAYSDKFYQCWLHQCQVCELLHSWWQNTAEGDTAQDMSYKHVQVSIVKDPSHPRPKRVCLLLSAKQYLSQGSTNYSPLKHCDREPKPCLSQAWTSLQYNHTYKTAKHKSAFMLCQRWTRSHRIHICSVFSK